MIDSGFLCHQLCTEAVDSFCLADFRLEKHWGKVPSQDSMLSIRAQVWCAVAFSCVGYSSHAEHER